MDSYREKAQKLLKEGEKKLSPGGFWSLFFGSNAKADEAAECYQRAGNLFKITKDWDEAAESFFKAANLLAKANCRHEAAASYVDAGHCFKKINTVTAENCYLKAIEIYLDMGRFTVAAKYHQTIAEMYEIEPLDYDKIIQHLEQASDYFRGEESISCANRCLLKVASYSAELENYEKAIVIYEQVAATVIENTLLKYCAKEYFFRAMLCHLCLDDGSSRLKFENYVYKYPALKDTREYKLVNKLICFLEEQNIDGLTEAVQEFDSVHRLDRWFIMMLLRVKNKLKDGKFDLR
ncbi:hypothetical protein Trydic_g20399 [Trypoxylus dichotomus]